jgi:hypothetical protein
MTRLAVDDILTRGDKICMKAWDYSSLARLVAERKLAPARKLTVGQLRIATVPSIIRPERQGAFDPEWLEPLPSRASAA